MNEDQIKLAIHGVLDDIMSYKDTDTQLLELLTGLSGILDELVADEE